MSSEKILKEEKILELAKLKNELKDSVNQLYDCLAFVRRTTDTMVGSNKESTAEKDNKPQGLYSEMYGFVVDIRSISDKIRAEIERL